MTSLGYVTTVIIPIFIMKNKTSKGFIDPLGQYDNSKIVLRIFVEITSETLYKFFKRKKSDIQALLVNYLKGKNLKKNPFKEFESFVLNERHPNYAIVQEEIQRLRSIIKHDNINIFILPYYIGHISEPWEKLFTYRNETDFDKSSKRYFQK